MQLADALSITTTTTMEARTPTSPSLALARVATSPAPQDAAAAGARLEAASAALSSTASLVSPFNVRVASGGARAFRVRHAEPLVPASVLPLAAAAVADTGSIAAGDGSRTERPDSGADASSVLGSRLRAFADGSGGVSGGVSGASGAGQVLNRQELKRMSERLARGKRRASVAGGGSGGSAAASPLMKH